MNKQCPVFRMKIGDDGLVRSLNFLGAKAKNCNECSGLDQDCEVYLIYQRAQTKVEPQQNTNGENYIPC
jgi:hypothetical protein